MLSYVSRSAPREDAELFFVPIYVSCNFSTTNGFLSLSHMCGMLAEAVELVWAQMSYWNRSNGADHVFFTSHDFGDCFHPMVSSCPKLGPFLYCFAAGLRTNMNLYDASCLLPAT
ncbi:hypothetical protein GUJ93_ZPchr0013g36333 [Zizania palustris]|uniref:Exostosin GT47 domain-containing protein n=1 Tax=Zizania palustris TaxID=103762 RepID=A0A8J5WUH9_ZIZPA|nr:hypothetical protein GUJ93_ZPchr0013g36333 [Zizania palustris]